MLRTPGMGLGIGTLGANRVAAREKLSQRIDVPPDEGGDAGVMPGAVAATGTRRPWLPLGATINDDAPKPLALVPGQDQPKTLAQFAWADVKRQPQSANKVSVRAAWYRVHGFAAVSLHGAAAPTLCQCPPPLLGAHAAAMGAPVDCA